MRGGAWDNGLFDLITKQTIRGHHGLEDFREMYRRCQTMNPYWADKRANIAAIEIPTYVVASYSTFVHTMGSIRGWLEVKSKDKWLRWDPYQEWYDLWAIKESRDELAQFFGKYLRGDDNGWEKTPRVRCCLLRFGNTEPIYPIVEEDYPIPRTKYETFYMQQDGTLSTAPSKSTGALSYNSENTGAKNGTVSFTTTFKKQTILNGLPKAVLHMSCDAHDDMIIYVLIRKLDRDGKAMYNLNIPWKAAPYKTMEEIPVKELSNLLIYYGPLGVLCASHREIDRSRSLHPQYPFHPHTNIQKILQGEVVEMEIGLWAMGIQFEEGEGLQVQISGQYPLVREFPQFKPPPVDEKNRGNHTIHVSEQHHSRIILPFV